MKRVTRFCIIAFIVLITALLYCVWRHKAWVFYDAQPIANPTVQLPTIFEKKVLGEKRDLLTTFFVNNPHIVNEIASRVSAASDGESRKSQRCVSLFSKLLAQQHPVKNLTLIGLDGRLICSVIPSKKDFYQDEPWWHEVRFDVDHKIESVIDFDEKNQQALLAMVFPVRDPVIRDIVGIVKVDFSLSEIVEEL